MGADAPSAPRVKICGHTTHEDLAASVAAGADAVGVIAAVDVETPREVSVSEAAQLFAAVPPLATGVLVTMPDSVADAVELVGRTSPDAIQVHGTLDPDAVADLRERVHVDVIAAIDAENEALAAYADAADALLVDTPAADGGGGTGRTHDWERTRDRTADLDVPIVLAGGLTPANVADAIAAVEPFGVDVASGVERDQVPASDASAGPDVEHGEPDAERRDSSAGAKDHDAVRAFVANARSAGGASRRSEQSADDDRGVASTEGSR